MIHIVCKVVNILYVAFTIYNLVRALTKPYVGAHIEYNGKDIKIWNLMLLQGMLQPMKVQES